MAADPRSPRSRSRSRDHGQSDDSSETDDISFQRKQHEGFKYHQIDMLKKQLFKWQSLRHRKGKHYDTTRPDYSAPSRWTDYAIEGLRAMARLVKVNEEPITDVQKDTPTWDREFNSSYFD